MWVVEALEATRFCNTSMLVFFLCTGEAFNNCAILDDYLISEKIGEGGFGTVHLATNKETNKQYAVKYMDMTATRKYNTMPPI